MQDCDVLKIDQQEAQYKGLKLEQTTRGKNLRLNLPLGWNIFDMNLTVGGLLGYSSVNSICNLNVPVGTNTKYVPLINTA